MHACAFVDYVHTTRGTIRCCVGKTNGPRVEFDNIVFGGIKNSWHLFTTLFMRAVTRYGVRIKRGARTAALSYAARGATAERLQCRTRCR